MGPARHSELTLSPLRTLVHASARERARPLPGDELIAAPIGSLTHALTICAPRQHVWPWIVQMGAGSRAGWYSYDFIDNGGRRSAARIVPELQQISVGLVFPALPGAKDGFIVLAFEPNRHLVLGWPSPYGMLLTTWAFVLDEIEHEWTRLIVRARGAPGYHFHALPWWLAKPVVSIGHFIMQRKQLLGIARRAEHALDAISKRDARPQ